MQLLHGLHIIGRGTFGTPALTLTMTCGLAARARMRCVVLNAMAPTDPATTAVASTPIFETAEPKAFLASFALNLR